MLSLTTLTTLLLLTLTTAQGTTSLTSVTCGATKYTKPQVDQATAEGCRLFSSGQTLGDNDYPHRFNNREGLAFAASGPYQEFPILSNGQNYTGRAPGPDRVVFKTSGGCAYVGAITHTDAPTNGGFVLCTEVKGSATATTSPTRSATGGAATGTETSGAQALGVKGWVLGGLMVAPFVLV